MFGRLKQLAGDAMGRLAGKMTMSEVAEAFPAQLDAIKMILYTWFQHEIAKGFRDADLAGLENPAGLIAAQVVNRLLAEDLTASMSALPEAEAHFVRANQADTADLAHRFMREDRELRELVVAALRIRYVLHSAYHQEWQGSDAAKRIEALLGQ